MKEKTIKDLTSHLKRKKGIINTISITNIVCVANLLIIINYLVIKEELLSVSAEKQKDLETQQEVITLRMLQLRERNKHIGELKKSLKGNLCLYLTVI